MKDCNAAGWMPTMKLVRVEKQREPELVKPDFERDCWDYLIEPIYEECSTCGGHGFIDETLGGCATSNPRAVCPDCEGVGGFRLERTEPASTAPAQNPNAAGQASPQDGMSTRPKSATEHVPAAPDADSWIPWDTSKPCPNFGDQYYQLRLADGQIDDETWSGHVLTANWKKGAKHIGAYRIAKATQ